MNFIIVLVNEIHRSRWDWLSIIDPIKLLLYRFLFFIIIFCFYNSLLLLLFLLMYDYLLPAYCISSPFNNLKCVVRTSSILINSRLSSSINLDWFRRLSNRSSFLWLNLLLLRFTNNSSCCIRSYLSNLWSCISAFICSASKLIRFIWILLWYIIFRKRVSLTWMNFILRLAL